LLQAASIELGLAEHMHQANRPPKRVIVIDRTNQARNRVLPWRMPCLQASSLLNQK
jgi:hypothetical protein